MPELKAKKIEIKHFGWHAFPVNENDRVVPNNFHAKYIIGGSLTENKVYSFSTILSLSMANRIHGCLHTNTLQGIYYLTT